MPIALDHVFAVVLAVLFPVRAAFFGYRRLAHAAPADVPSVRLWLYRQGIQLQWGLTAVCLALWVWQGRPWAALGVVPAFNLPLLIVAVLFGVLVVVVARQRRAAIEDADTMARLRDQVRGLERMLPRSDRELRWFVRLSITAGICEELLYRGYLIWYVDAYLGLAPAVVVASVVFGFGHAYQGRRGILLTTLVGLVMSGIYVFTGSLLMGTIIHALMDIYSGHMAREAFIREPVPDAFEAPPLPPALPVDDGVAARPAPAGPPLDAQYPAPGAVTADDPEG